MSNQGNDKSLILKVASLSSLVAVANLISSLLRMKVFALMLGPSLLGYMGILNNYMQMIGTCATLGVGSAAIRQLGDLTDSKTTMWSTASRIVKFGVVLAALAALGALLASPLIPRLLSIEFTDAAILSAGIAGLVLSTIFVGVMYGLVLINAYAIATMAGTVLGTLAAILSVFLLGKDGIVFAVILVPVATVLAYSIAGYRNGLLDFSRSQGKPSGDVAVITAMINMGVPMTILLLLQTGTILVIRQMLLQVSGEVENGYFHVAWALAGTINSLLISSLDGDFLRRLSHAARDKSLAAVAVHHQVELVTRPLTVVVVLFVAFTNIAVVVLLSREFMPAILSIQVMVISELFRGLASVYGKTPFAYGHPWLAMLPDLISAIALIGSAYFLIPAAGAFGAAVAFLLSRLLLLGVSVVLSSLLLGKNPSSEELVLLGASGLAVLLVLAASNQSLIFGYLIGVAGLIYGVRVAYSLFAQR